MRKIKLISISLMIGSIIGFFFLNIIDPNIPILNFVNSVIPELFGIGLTVLLIDSVNASEQRKALIAKLIIDMGSMVNSVAVHSVECLRTLDEFQNKFPPKTSFWSANLQYSQLHYFDFTGCNIAQAIFKEANLSQSNLSNQEIISSDFSYCSLDGADLSNSVIGDSIFVGTRFTNANLECATFINVDLSETINLTEIQINTCASMEGCKLPNGMTYTGISK